MYMQTLAPPTAQPILHHSRMAACLLFVNLMAWVRLSSVSVPEVEWVEETGSHLYICHETQVLDLWLLG